LTGKYIPHILQTIKSNVLSIRDHFAPENPDMDETDGLSLSFPAWRFNIRLSNTEPLMRLNVETRANKELLRAKVAEITNLVNNG